MAKTLAEVTAEIQQNAADQTALITQQTTVLQGVTVFIQGQAAQLAGLRQQVQDLIDAGGGDPATVAQLEAIAATLQAQETSLASNTQAISDAVLANTPPA